MKKLWFKRKLYGWGWYPSSWEGWVAILIYAATITKIVVLADSAMYEGVEVLVKVVLPSVLSTVILIMICYKKGESPRWQWGPASTRGDSSTRGGERKEDK